MENLGYVQIDTIAVVERAHHHVLWSRVPDYEPAHLHELLSHDKTVFEYWSHAASYLPMRDFRFSLPMMHAIQNGKMTWYATKPKMEMRKILARIEKEGALAISDFKEKSKKRGDKNWDYWFNRKPSKWGLEQLFYEGKLMVSGRKNFQKIYDLTERVLPKHVSQDCPEPAEHARHLILKALRAHGFASLSELTYQDSFNRKNIQKELERLVSQGEIVQVELEGGFPSYCFPATLEWISRRQPEPSREQVHILSPFDNMVIQRKRLKYLFAFDYVVECYVPQPKRKFGYFCLPLLFGGELVARIDAKADRLAKKLVVHRLWMERGFKRSKDFNAKLEEALESFARFNGCKQVDGVKIF